MTCFILYRSLAPTQPHTHLPTYTNGHPHPHTPIHTHTLNPHPHPHTPIHTHTLNPPPHMHTHSYAHNIDINECVEGHDNCSHICENTVGSYTCRCHGGFRLGFDGYTCEGMYMHMYVHIIRTVVCIQDVHYTVNVHVYCIYLIFVLN